MGSAYLYAPNQVATRAPFCRELCASLPDSTHHWIVGGDFNMVEYLSNRRWGNPFFIHGHKLASWELLFNCSN
jgi:hypothetical protein